MGKQRAPRRILIVTEAGTNWPSAYIRALIYRDLLVRDGFQVRHVSRLVPEITKWIVHPGRFTTRLMDLGVGRILADFNGVLGRIRENWICRAAASADVVYLQKVHSLALLQSLRRSTRARLVFDLNDALWLPWMRRFAGENVEQLITLADAVTCNNPHSVQFACQLNPQVFLVPDPSQVEFFDQFRSQVRKEPDRIVLGWIGSAGTAFNLLSIWEPLEQLFQRFDQITLRLVGAGYDWRLLPRFERVRYSVLPYYSREQMAREVLAMDVGLFPLFNVEDSLARGILKATIYMSGEACVVTPPFGQNCDLIEDGKNGYFAADPQQWLDRLSRLIENRDERRSLAAAGLQTVRQHFSLDRCYQSLRAALLGEK